MKKRGKWGEKGRKKKGKSYHLFFKTLRKYNGIA